MAITRSQQARQLYRDAGYVQAAYGKSAATPGPVEYDTGVEQQRTENIFNETIQPKKELSVNEVLTKAGDVQRVKNAITGGGLTALISPQMIIGKLILDQIQKNKDENENQTIVEPVFAEGGDVVGGEYDFDSARQMYGLGKLVKKITRSVKKVVKSPIGKAALLYTGLGGLGSLAQGGSFFTNFANPLSQIRSVGSIFAKGGLDNIMARTGLGEFVPGGPGDAIFKKNFLGKALTSPTALISAASAVAGALTPEQEAEAQQIADETGIAIETIRANPNEYLGRRFRAEGGSMDEPVAKKTMPLLDMDGQEMDLRAEGGFVPIGRMEKADDVPARLSKNEFVFTADAVRNAGEGDVDKGAEVMYNMMKNLESGGEVSEESQGLEGAREMFQTSQRLEEVI